MDKDEEVFSSELVQKGSLVIVINEDRDQPVRLGLVTRMTSNDLFDVKYGPALSGRRQQEYVNRENVFFLVQTDGRFTDPAEAFKHYLFDIVIELVIAVRMSKELQTIKRLKARKAKIEKNLRRRIGRGLLGLLGHIPIIGGKTRTQ